MAQPTPTGDDERLSLQAAADILGVHYMTAYRYVRTGRLDAVRDGSHWYVSRAAIANLRAAGAPGRNKLGSSTPTPRLRRRAHDTPRRRRRGRVLAGRCRTRSRRPSPPEQLYLEIVGPALHAVGDNWEAGTISIAEEHRASALAYRLLGRLGPTFTRRGPARGPRRVGRAERRPPRPRIRARRRSAARPRFHGRRPRRRHTRGVVRRDRRADDRTRAVGIVVSVPIDDDVIASTIAAVHSARSVPVLIGGRTITDAAHAAALGADAFSASAPEAIAWFDSIGLAPPPARRPAKPTA